MAGGVLVRVRPPPEDMDVREGAAASEADRTSAENEHQRATGQPPNGHNLDTHISFVRHKKGENTCDERK
ncbi:hypothetical protein DaAHT2_0942 [Desulfurivibrio alkaliphilus AHT 2]|uniref:Uncharacterized protein n=1 Tax=Desulfurivibrio alkaliphilus (strain DSM 19089 / UNIQEM U267 / AHT2) TaxID=589865 RepID=D6Z270_DESAT|nr:hypothetical protein DaAHT2_0942 [Desulfurivibrio alkaliphilus AHT 2]